MWCLCEDGTKMSCLPGGWIQCFLVPALSEQRAGCFCPNLAPHSVVAVAAVVVGEAAPVPACTALGEGLYPALEGIMGALALGISVLALPPRDLRTMMSD